MSSTFKIPGKKKLRPLCKALGLSQKGSKQDLLRRLKGRGLTLEKIAHQASNVVLPSKRYDLSEGLRDLRRNDFYETALPASINDLPGERSLRSLCKRFGLTGNDNKLVLLQRLLGHGLSFNDIVTMTGYTEPFIPPYQSVDSPPPTLPLSSATMHIDCSVEELSSSRSTPIADEGTELRLIRGGGSGIRVLEVEIIVPPCSTTIRPSTDSINTASTIFNDLLGRSDLVDVPMVVNDIDEMSDLPIVSHASDDIVLSNLLYVSADLSDLLDVPMLPNDLSADSDVSSAQYVCNVCGKSYRFASGLSRHKRQHRQDATSATPATTATSATSAQCGVCGKSFANKFTLNRHMKLHQQAQPVQCHVCGTAFVEKRYLQPHMVTHDIVHPKDFGGNVFVFGGPNVGFQYVNFDDKIHQAEMLQIVCIPWFDSTGTYVNLSVGFTKYNNIVAYAKSIWYQIRHGINNGSLYLSGCGSGRLAAQRLDWVMRPEESFALGICVETRVAANRVKGNLRDLLDSVYILSADDKNGFLRTCLNTINSMVEQSLHKLSAHNVAAFHGNLSGHVQAGSFRLLVSHNKHFHFDSLDIVI